MVLAPNQQRLWRTAWSRPMKQWAPAHWNVLVPFLRAFDGCVGELVDFGNLGELVVSFGNRVKNGCDDAVGARVIWGGDRGLGVVFGFLECRKAGVGLGVDERAVDPLLARGYDLT